MMRFAPKPFNTRNEDQVYTHKHTKVVPFNFTSDRKPDAQNYYEMSVYERNKLEYLSEINNSLSNKSSRSVGRACDRLAKFKEAESHNSVVVDHHSKKRSSKLEPMGLSCNRIGHRASSSGFRN